jgi:hypothetical protein
MATATPLSHPDEAAQTEHFYPHTVTIKGVDPTTGDLVNVFSSACAYEPAAGGDPAMFEDEAAANDKIYLPTWEPSIAAKSLAILQIGTLEKRFDISDVLPLEEGPNRTLLSVTPAKS